jgi:hypothetical protein
MTLDGTAISITCRLRGAVAYRLKTPNEETRLGARLDEYQQSCMLTV